MLFNILERFYLELVTLFKKFLLNMFSSIIGTFDRIIKYHMWQAIVLVKGRGEKKNKPKTHTYWEGDTFCVTEKICLYFTLKPDICSVNINLD